MSSSGQAIDINALADLIIQAAGPEEALRAVQEHITLPMHKPRPYQLPLWDYLTGGGKRAICIWHRRAGKDEIGMNWAAVCAERKPATYWHMLPEAAQARKAIWEAVDPHTGKRRIDDVFPSSLRKTTRENEMLIRFHGGATWQLVGSDNYNSLMGSPPYGVVFSEWALADPQAWAYIRPILVENGGWALFITTPRGYNHAKTMLDMAAKEADWFSQTLTVDDTGIFNPVDMARERREYIAQYGEDQGLSLFEQEYYCSFESAILGAYYAGEMRVARTEGRITSVPHDPMLPVSTYWDLGIDDSMTIWFAQETAKEIRLIDYYELSGEGLKHYAGVLDQKRTDLGYRYGRHVAPHDIKVRELGTGKSRWEVAKDIGLNFEITRRVEKKEDGIQAVRAIFPKCWFDSSRCEKGVNALSSYRKHYDEKNKVYGVSPVHDWSSHGADAFQTLAISDGKQGGGVLVGLGEAYRV